MKKILKFFISPLFAWILIGLIVIAGGAYGYKMYRKEHPLKKAAAKPTVNAYAAFTGEVYDTIQNNYWNKISDADLSNLYLLATEKIASTTVVSLVSQNKSGAEALVVQVTNGKASSTASDMTAQINNIVLVNLQPFGRSSLYTTQLAQNLNNEVNNVNPSDNLYSFLDLPKTATVQQVNQAYQQQSQKLAGQTSQAAKDQLAKVDRAEAALGTTTNKQAYDQTGAEPAVTGHLIGQQVLYTDFVRFTPTMLQDFDNVLLQYASSSDTTDMIIDLRGDIGGDIDLMPYVSGVFVGIGQYPYQLYHQGTSTPVQTTLDFLPELAKYKKIAVLTDGQTQSSAELLASVLKKYHVGVLVGTKTKGWGTIESDMDLKNQIDPTQHYSVFLVHTLTLGDNNQPIESHGVAPNVDITDKNWPAELNTYFNDPNLLSAVKQEINQ